VPAQQIVWWHDERAHASYWRSARQNARGTRTGSPTLCPLASSKC